MIRLTALFLFVTAVAVFTWRDWFKGLCAIIVLMAVMERPDMPKSMLGIPGLNPVNFLLLNCVVAWWFERLHTGRRMTFDRDIGCWLLVYMAFIIISNIRLLLDHGGLEDMALLGRPVFTTSEIWREFFLNTFKWLIPGVLLYDGCRTEERQRLALFALLAAFFVLALLVIHSMPLSRFSSGESLTRDSLKIDKRVGFHRVDVSMLMAGAFWSYMVSFSFIKEIRLRSCLAAATPVLLVGMLLTGGRAGYLAWAVLGFLFVMVRWRKYILLLMLLGATVVLAVPGVQERIMTGLEPSGGVDAAFVSPEDVVTDELGAGRLVIWPIVMEQIRRGPLIGFGRMAMVRKGVTRQVMESVYEFANHPHNAYLEWWLDTGVVGLFIVFVFFGKACIRAYKLFMRAPTPTGQMVGGVALALIISYLVAAMTAQSFYPRESVVFMWAGLFLALRVYRDQRAVR